MNLNIVEVEAYPRRSIAVRTDGRRIEESTRMTAGNFKTPFGEVEWDKYFITNHMLKRREDFVVVRSRDVPKIGETFARLNRAALIGERAIRRCNAVFGARLNSEAVVCETEGVCVSSSMNMQFGIDLPLEVSELADVDEFDVKEDGEGLSWLRISNRHFDLYAYNPAMTDQPTLGVVIPTESPGATIANPKHMRWEYADALLTPSTAELPGALGDMSIRAALLSLRPGLAKTN